MFSFVLLVLFASPAATEELGNDTCLDCHGVEGFSTGAGRSLFVNGETFEGSVHGVFPCTACHADVTDIPHAEKLEQVGPGTCASCHGEVVGLYQQSIHGQARAHGVSEAANCSDCHGSPHGMKAQGDKASPVYHLNLPRTCGVCHGDAALGKRYGISVTNAYEPYIDSIHGQAVTKSGLLVAANCSSCHGSHGIRPRNDPAAKVNRANVIATCGTCHAGVIEPYEQGVHWRALQAGNPRAPICIDCHTSHEIARVDTVAWQLEIISECGTCHEESLRTYRDTLHGQVTALGFTRVARCSDCHGSHKILPHSDPESTVSSERLVSTCQQCHPQANEHFVRFQPHADPSNRERSPGLFFVAQFMNLLMVGVFSFFGLHTALWFLRSLFERGESEEPPQE